MNVTPGLKHGRYSTQQNAILYGAEGRLLSMTDWAARLGCSTLLLRARLAKDGNFADVVRYYRARQSEAQMATPLSAINEEDTHAVRAEPAPKTPMNVPPPRPRRPSLERQGAENLLNIGPCGECAQRASSYYSMIHHDHVREGALPLVRDRLSVSPPQEEPSVPPKPTLRPYTYWSRLLPRSAPEKVFAESSSWPDPHDGVM